MKQLLLASAFAALCSINAGHADTVSFTSLATLPPPGETYVPFPSGSNLVTGSVSGSYLAPLLASGPDTSPYLAVLGGTSIKIPVPEELVVEIYVGTLDAYNHFAFSNGDSWSGADIAGLGIGASDNGSPTDPMANGLLTFTFDKGVNSVTLSSDSNTLEVAGIWSSNAVPEPATWAMMGLGFAGLAFAGYRARRTPAEIV